MGEPKWCPGVQGQTEPHDSTTDQFYWRMNHGKKRIDNICKACNSVKVRIWRANNRDRIRAYDRQYHTENIEKVRVYNREYYRMTYGKGAWVWKRYRDELDQEIRLPSEPFRVWLEEHIVPLLASKKDVMQASGEATGAANDLITWSSIAEKIGVDRKTITNYTGGKVKNVPREIIDRMGLLFGHMNLSDELYEDQLEESA